MENDIVELAASTDAENAKVGNGEIVILKLYSGDYIIGEVSGDAVNGKIPLDNPRVFGMMPTMTGSVSVVFQSVCIFSKKAKKHADISESEVMYRVGEDELSKEIINGYKSEITGIKIASAAESAAINSDGGKGGDFIL